MARILTTVRWDRLDQKTRDAAQFILERLKDLPRPRQYFNMTLKNELQCRAEVTEKALSFLLLEQQIEVFKGWNGRMIRIFGTGSKGKPKKIHVPSVKQKPTGTI